MGIYDRALAKIDPRITEIARARLDPGEEIQVSVSASTPMNPLGIALCVAPMVLFANLTVYEAWSPLVLGLSIGIYIAVTVRMHYLVLTERHLLVVKLAFTSPKKVEEEHLIDRADVEAAELKQRTLTDLLTITSRAFTEKLQVGGSYRPRAEELVRRLMADSSAPTA